MSYTGRSQRELINKSYSLILALILTDHQGTKDNTSSMLVFRGLFLNFTKLTKGIIYTRPELYHYYCFQFENLLLLHGKEQSKVNICWSHDSFEFSSPTANYLP